ncbi:MAG: acetolactate synthase [Chthoniobacterales bacterium]
MATRTAESLGGAQVRQFSVFLPNKVGALLEIVKLLNEHAIIVLALSILDSSETAIVRIVVSDPDPARELFHEHDIAYSICDLLAVELREGAADLAKVLSSLLKAEVNVFFSYSLLIRPRDKTVLALHLDDMECASAVLRGDGFRLLTQADLSR